MKRFLLISITALWAFCAQALNYDEARQHAWFLTDKMAYELNLTPEQYDRVYEVNLDYFMSLRSPSDCYGSYWEFRNADLVCILFDWQYAAYRALDYFLRPIRWVRSAWYFPVFERYRPGYYYFSRPGVYVSYRGVGWRHRSRRDVSPYRGVHFRSGVGLRDRYNHNRRPGQAVPGGRPNHGPGYQRPGNAPASRPDNRPGNRPGAQPGQRPGNRPSGGENNREQRQQRPSSQRGQSNRPSRNYDSRQGSSRARQTPSRPQSTQRQSAPSREFGRSGSRR